MFDPFFSTAPRPGHGLGLAFVKRVVDLSGGTIKVKSTLGLGTSVLMSFPLSNHETQSESDLARLGAAAELPVSNA